MKRRGIFFKVFTYTTIFLVVIVCVTVALFSQQFLSFYNTTQTEQLYTSFQSLHERLRGKDFDEIINGAEEFYRYNQSFTFFIMSNDGNVVYSTPDITENNDFNAGEYRIRMTVGSDYTLFATNRTAEQANYGGLIQKSLFALISMLAAGVAGAFIFARQMTNPIKRLASDTKRMAVLQDVSPLPERHDEIGSLGRDVHSMYGKLKETISQLEDEIIRVREMEETQRYFFSAASHELKTPIAAASVLLEGMIENIGDYKDRPKYLRECVKLMDSQNKVISEILELVNLNDEKIVPFPEELSIYNEIMSIMPNYQTLADANGQRITVNISEEHICFTDKKMLEKVLSNIVLNAVQNTLKDGEIRIWCEPVADQYRVCVLNTGTHIEKEALTKLFDPFYRADKARTRKDGRSGLGLTIVKKTLEAMGADYELTQTKDGILFWLDLPSV
jgi:two-component system sensor histidine kinase VanS